MPPPLNVDKEQVRMLVMTHGVSEASRMTGISLDAIKQWSSRGKWLKSIPNPEQAKANAIQAMPPSIRPVTVVTKAPADAMKEALEDDSRQTRISLSRAARNMSAQAESADLDDATNTLQVAKIAALVHKWEGQAEKSIGSVSSVTIEGGQVVINQQFNSDQ